VICPKCGGNWTVRRRRCVCATCGFLDARATWVDGVYCGPPDLNPEGLSPATYTSRTPDTFLKTAQCVVEVEVVELPRAVARMRKPV
jgi:hypothetical protein